MQFLQGEKGVGSHFEIQYSFKLSKEQKDSRALFPRAQEATGRCKPCAPHAPQRVRAAQIIGTPREMAALAEAHQLLKHPVRVLSIPVRPSSFRKERSWST
jgi:hypothetical protein